MNVSSRISPHLNLLASIERSAKTKQAQIARQRLPTKSTPCKTTYSIPTCAKWRKKRQGRLAEMWQVAAPEVKKKKKVPGNYVMKSILNK